MTGKYSPVLCYMNIITRPPKAKNRGITLSLSIVNRCLNGRILDISEHSALFVLNTDA